MGWLAKLFGLSARLPERRTSLLKGFFWKYDDFPALAAGRGFNQQVSGESFYRRELEELAGGPTIHGVKIDAPALLITTTWEDRPAVMVCMGEAKVGSIPSADAPALHSELTSISAAGRATAKGRIEAGFQDGDYCVKLSLARPLRLRSS